MEAVVSEKGIGYDVNEVGNKIIVVRGQKVMLDRDLASLYGVTTFRFNEAMKRNRKRFLGDFAFQLTREEFNALISQNAISSGGHGGVRKFPWVFTEHGALMASTVLNSPRAVEMSRFVIKAFVKLRERLVVTGAVEKRLEDIEKKLVGHDAALRDLYSKLRPLLLAPPSDKPKRRIGFTAEEKSEKYG
jgi:hypothetical protein